MNFRRFLFRALWAASVLLPTLLVGLIVAYFLRTVWDEPREGDVRLVFSAAAILLTIAAVCFSAARAADEGVSKREFLIGGFRIFQGGLLMVLGAILVHASGSISVWGGALAEGSLFMNVIGFVGRVTVGGAVGTGFVGLWWLLKALWTAQHNWLER